jgi:hypothetical protein
MAVELNSETSSEASEYERELESFITQMSGLQRRSMDSYRSASCASDCTTMNNGTAGESNVQSCVLDDRSIQVMSKKLKRQKKLLMHLKQEHAYSLARLRDEFESRVDSITQLHNELVATKEAKMEERYTALEREFQMNDFKLKAQMVVSSRVSEDYNKALEQLSAREKECSESKEYIKQLEARLREFHVPFPSIFSENQQETFQLLSSFRRRSGSN